MLTTINARWLIGFIFIAFLPVTISAQKVLSLTIDGSINPASAEFIENGIEKAVEENASCLIIKLNTPGGLLNSTRTIVSNILESPVPIVVYVTPAGAHAGSAGVFITMAANIAAMTPGTNIGAAHPVSTQGSMDSIMNEKGTNDAAAFIRTIAEKRKRNVQWAEEAVRQSVSITEQEAKDKLVIDLVVRNEKELMQLIHGRTVETSDGNKILNTKDANIEEIEMGVFVEFLNMISDPNVAYILMMLGFYGIMFELYSPGAIFPGVVGVICLILAFYSMNTLPVNYAGIALIVFGIILFILEIKIISHGILAIGGIISVLLGSVILFRSSSPLEFVQFSWGVIIGCTAVTASFFLIIVAMALRTHKLQPRTGIEGLIGENGITLGVLNPSGTIRVHGETWNAKSLSGPINTGEQVIVKSINNLTLLVEIKS